MSARSAATTKMTYCCDAMQKLIDLYESWSGSAPSGVESIDAAGSNRQYFRLMGADGGSVIGVIGTSRDENHAFVYLSNHFKKRQLPVPRILAVAGDELRYLQEDLGRTSLFGAVSGGRDAGGRYNQKEKQLLVNTIRELPNIQIRGARGLDWTNCYPQPEFDEDSVLFDLNYFKYCFLKPTELDFHELKLEANFRLFAKDLVAEKADSFMYRDFQARNVMLDAKGKPYFIDYQGGRKGPYYYDLASFLWQASARYPNKLRRELVYEYYNSLKLYTEVPSVRHFVERLSLFVLFRTLQVLGAYGFRGLYEKKRHFMESIPYAMANIREFLSWPSGVCPYLSSLLQKLSDPACSWSRFIGEDSGTLTVEVTSFSYRKGIPDDRSGNGGGYVFDCRALENPGRYERYRSLTGMDAEVIGFMEEDGGVFPFLDNIYALVDPHIRYFLHRGFTHLSVCFGCTGGQHRSVYCAESLAKHVVSSFGNAVRVVLVHREQNIVSYPGRDKEDR